MSNYATQETLTKNSPFSLEAPNSFPPPSSPSDHPSHSPGAFPSITAPFHIILSGLPYSLLSHTSSFLPHHLLPPYPSLRLSFHPFPPYPPNVSVHIFPLIHSIPSSPLHHPPSPRTPPLYSTRLGYRVLFVILFSYSSLGLHHAGFGYSR